MAEATAEAAAVGRLRPTVTTTYSSRGVGPFSTTLRSLTGAMGTAERSAQGVSKSTVGIGRSATRASALLRAAAIPVLIGAIAAAAYLVGPAVQAAGGALIAFGSGLTSVLTGVGLLVAAAKPIIGAMGNITEAQKTARTAQLNYNAAVSQFGKNSSEAKSALKTLHDDQAKVNQLMQQATPAVRTVSRAWGGLTNAYQRNFTENKKLENTVADLGAKVLNIARNAMPALGREAQRTATSVQRAFAGLTENLSSRDRSSLFGILNNAHHLLGSLVTAAGHASLALANMFGSPAATKDARALAGWLDKITNNFYKWSQTRAARQEIGDWLHRASIVGKGAADAIVSIARAIGRFNDQDAKNLAGALRGIGSAAAWVIDHLRHAGRDISAAIAAIFKLSQPTKNKIKGYGKDAVGSYGQGIRNNASDQIVKGVFWKNLGHSIGTSIGTGLNNWAKHDFPNLHLDERVKSSSNPVQVGVWIGNNMKRGLNKTDWNAVGTRVTTDIFKAATNPGALHQIKEWAGQIKDWIRQRGWVGVGEDIFNAIMSGLTLHFITGPIARVLTRNANQAGDKSKGAFKKVGEGSAASYVAGFDHSGITDRVTAHVQVAAKKSGDKSKSNFRDAGHSSGLGFLDGFQKAGVAGGIVEVIQNAVRRVKHWLGISSPSKVFASIGKDSGEGFGQGFAHSGIVGYLTRKAKDAYNAVKNFKWFGIGSDAGKGVGTGFSHSGIVGYVAKKVKDAYDAAKSFHWFAVGSDAGKGVGSGFAHSGIVGMIVGKVIDAYNAVKVWLQSHSPSRRFAALGSDAGKGMGEGFSHSGIVGYFAKKAKDAYDAVRGFKWGSVGSDAGQAVGSAFAHSGIVRYFANKARDAYNAVKGFRWWGVGTDAAKGFINGFTHSGIVGAIVGKIGDAYNAVKDFLQSHSPSRRFAVLGQSAAEGFAKGLLRGAGLLRSASKKMVDSVANAVKDGIVNLGDVPRSVWDQLLKRGWKGNPNDNAERLYAPRGFGSSSRSMLGDKAPSGYTATQQRDWRTNSRQSPGRGKWGYVQAEDGSWVYNPAEYRKQQQEGIGHTYVHSGSGGSGSRSAMGDKTPSGYTPTQQRDWRTNSRQSPGRGKWGYVQDEDGSWVYNPALYKAQTEHHTGHTYAKDSSVPYAFKPTASGGYRYIGGGGSGSGSGSGGFAPMDAEQRRLLSIIKGGGNYDIGGDFGRSDVSRKVWNALKAAGWTVHGNGIFAPGTPKRYLNAYGGSSGSGGSGSDQSLRDLIAGARSTDSPGGKHITAKEMAAIMDKNAEKIGAVVVRALKSDAYASYLDKSMGGYFNHRDAMGADAR